MQPSRGLKSGPVRSLNRAPTMASLSDVMDPDVVPSSLPMMIPKILHAANELEGTAPRVAFLCRQYAYEKAEEYDPRSAGRRVRQFKTALDLKLKQDDEPTWAQRTSSSDAMEVQNCYQIYYDKCISLLENSADCNIDCVQRDRTFKLAAVLFDVFLSVTKKESYEMAPEAMETGKFLASKNESCTAYNILPLDLASASQSVMMLPEIKAAVAALRNVRGLPWILTSEAFREKYPKTDVLDWLQIKFGFQKANVANQREHLILLLANVHIRQISKSDPESKLSDRALDAVMKKLFKNYRRWCRFLGRRNNLRLPTIHQEIRQRKLIYIGLYLLIWGEAANLRFMPECLCYIFHHMAYEVDHVLVSGVSSVMGEATKPIDGIDENTFLTKVVTRIYEVLAKEVKNRDEAACHSAWRNYDDLNEYFWSVECFSLGWPMRADADFFKSPKTSCERTASWIGKTHFVEVRSFWHIFRSFERMWTFFILVLQAMIIVAWDSINSTTEEANTIVFRKAPSIIITASILRLLQAIVDIGLSLKAWKNMKFSEILRYIMKLVVAIAWMIILPICYTRTCRSPKGLVHTLKIWFGHPSTGPSLCLTAVATYLIPDALGAIIFFFPKVRRGIEQSHWVVVQLLIWWSKPCIFVGRGIYENQRDLFKYTLFWVLVLISKFSFSYYFEVRPLVEVTKKVMVSPMAGKYKWHELFPKEKENLGVVIALWAPIIMVYFMDTQMWHALWSTIFGGINGAFLRIGEIRNLGMLRSRFSSLPGAFKENLVHHAELPHTRPFSFRRSYDKVQSEHRTEIARFSQLWNEVINSFREEDYITNKEMDLLLVPCLSNTNMKRAFWPPFLLANKIPRALEIAKVFTDTQNDDDLIKSINADEYMKCAIEECYELFLSTLHVLVVGEMETKLIEGLIKDVEMNISEKTLLKNFNLSKMYLLYQKLVELVEILCENVNAPRPLEERVLEAQKVTSLLQDILEVYIRDIRRHSIELQETNTETSLGMHGTFQERYHHQLFLEDTIHYPLPQSDLCNEHKIQERYHQLHMEDAIHYPPAQSDVWNEHKTFQELYHQLFMEDTIRYPPPQSDVWNKQIKRLHSLLTANESYMNIPANLEAQRRITFFTSSLFMDMPPAPKVHNMLSFSVLTPYHDEEILYTEKVLGEKNEVGVSILDYLQNTYPDEWKNFLERTKYNTLNNLDNEVSGEVCKWASYRAQTLIRTVRGMMYYRRALELQAFLDMATENEIQQGYKAALQSSPGELKSQRSLYANIQAVVDMKFTYVVTCQNYVLHKRTADRRATDILHLMTEYPALRVAYIEDNIVDQKKEYYSVLSKGIKDNCPEAIYKIKLPGNPILGEGKAENQNHAIIFSRGEALQAIDINQDNYLEESLKMRNLLQEFLRDDEIRCPSILGIREHIFTESVSSLSEFVQNQESSFEAIGRRVLANPLRVRFHYGHPDVFDRLFHISRGGISKASPIINLSNDIFAGFNTTLRQGNITHHDYIQVGKGRDVGLNQISLFEAKIAQGNAEQTLSRDLYRLGHHVDFFRMLSVYFTTVGCYLSSLMAVLTIYIFLYGRIYLALSGLEQNLVHLVGLQKNTALQAAVASQSFVQIGLLMALPMVMEISLEKGLGEALSKFIFMQIQLASVFFTFSVGTKAHFYGRTLLYGGVNHLPIRSGLVVFHARFAENYRLYSRTHFTKGLELMILLIVYNLYGASGEKTVAYLLITFYLWFLVGTWLFAPFLFNPSGFEWQKILDDWDDWIKWIHNPGGLGVPGNKSWESWWEEEQANLKGLRGKFMEIVLSARFFLYQYGIVYHLNITHQSKSILVYAMSWLVLFTTLAIVKVVMWLRRRFSATSRLFLRLLKGGSLMVSVTILTILFVLGDLTIKDIFAIALAFIPTGWALLQIARTFNLRGRKFGMWDSIRVLARAYDYVMGLLLFVPIATLAWFPLMSDFQTRLLFNQAFSRGLQISEVLHGRKGKKAN